MSIFEQLENIRNNRGAVAVALIDPDSKYDNILSPMIELINESDFDIIFAGGSMVADREFNNRIKFIKENTDLPLIIFPGSYNQISKYADAILYLSLLSGRNPKYLISDHVKSARLIHNLSLETISTAYILIDGGMRSSVEHVSNTKPIPMYKHDIILAHALAGEYLGKKYIFLDAGSGAKHHITCEIISYLKLYITIPIIVGGGINTVESASTLVNSGADYIVTGTQLEHLPNNRKLIQFTNSVHRA